MQWWFKHIGFMRHTFNLWPPFFLTGIKVESISSDFSRARLKLKWRPWLKNLNRSQFGGSMFAMTDPIYSVLLLGSLGMDKYYVWDQKASIDFKKPAYEPVWFEAHIPADKLTEIKEQAAGGEKVLPEFVDTITNAKGEVIAEIHRTLYVRLKPKYRPQPAER